MTNPITQWWLAARGGVLIPRRYAWRLYLAATLVGAGAGLIGAAFHAVLDGADHGRAALQATLGAAPVPGWLILMALGALLLTLSLWLVRRFAPETAGSGIPEVEAILAGTRPLRWQRVLPVKFIAGALAIGSGLVLGREGPTVHMGAAVGQMAAAGLGRRRAGLDPATRDRCPDDPSASAVALDAATAPPAALPTSAEPKPAAPEPARLGADDEHGRFEGDRRTLIAAGAAAGLAAAFNAPLAAIVFVTEELREHFAYRFDSIQSVILACCAAVVVSGWLLGQGPVLPMPHLPQPPLTTLPLFLLLGVLIGILGVIFNWLILGAVVAFRALPGRQPYLAVAGIGLTVGALLWFAPASVGGGEHLVETLFLERHGAWLLLGLLAIRLLTTAGSYGTGVPGGIFAPMLALGTITGALFAELVALPLPGLGLDPRVFAVAAMGALFAATVRAPLTGIILVIELTGAQPLALPIILTCLCATFTAEALKGQPIYTLLLAAGSRPAPRAPWRVVLGAGLILLTLLVLPLAPRSFDGDHRRAPTVPEVAARAPTVPVSAVPVSATPPAPPPTVTPTPQPTPIEATVPTPAATIARASARAPAPTPQPADTPVGIGTASALAPAGADRASRPGAADTPRYSIQLISFRNADSLRPFAEGFGLLERARRLDTGGAMPRWHPVLLGEFTERAAAEAALAGLPADLRALDPIIRGIAPGERLRPLIGARPNDAE